MLNAVNPYIVGSPVTGSEMFFGREDVFTFIRQALIGKHRDNIIVLYGQRRTGKTSTLYQLPSHLGTHYLCVFVDLQALHLEGIDGFLWELANHIQRILQREHQIELPLLERQEFMVDARTFFQFKFLDQVWSAIGDRHLLLMLDEAIRLEEQVKTGKLEHHIFEYLSHLMQHYEQLNFLFSLGRGLEEMEKEYSLLFRTAVYKKISFLDRDTTNALITNPVKDYYKVEDAAQERIFQITSGHPYCIQLLCHNLFNRWQRHPVELVTVQDVEQVLEESVERGLAVFKHVWEESTPAEKAVMVAISEITGDASAPVSTDSVNQAWKSYKVCIPQGEMAQALKNLISRDVIKGTDTYVFCVDLQRLWIQKYRRFGWVAEEIAETMHTWATTGKNRIILKAAQHGVNSIIAGDSFRPNSQPKHPLRSFPVWRGVVSLAVVIAIIIVSLVVFDYPLLATLLGITPTINITSNYHDNGIPAGAIGTNLHVRGHNFSPNSLIIFLLDGIRIQDSIALQEDMRTKSDASGNFSTDLTVASDWSVQQHTLTARDTSNHITNNGIAISIVQQGYAGTPGPHGAPSNTANFKISIQFDMQSGYNSFLANKHELDVKGRSDSQGGKVCAPHDDGSQQKNQFSLSNGTIITEASTYTCSDNNTYKGGQITYDETLGTDIYSDDNSGTCHLKSPQSSYLTITGTFTAPNLFTGTVFLSFIGADQYVCTGDLNFGSSTSGDRGTWIGKVSNS